MQTRTINIFAVVIIAALTLSGASGCAKVDAGTGRATPPIPIYTSRMRRVQT